MAIEAFWTPERVATLSALAKDHTSREMAALLGTTRNAVISKCTREGIELKPVPWAENPGWKAVLRCIKAGQDTSRAIGEHTGISRRYVSDLLVDLEDRGKIHRVGTMQREGSKGCPMWVWELGAGASA